MCGISGEVAFEGDLHPEQLAVETMTATMESRGPDDEGVWMSDHAVLGHRRLSVIDPEHGHQPMEVATGIGSVALTYNGEVYNAAEVRLELEAHGHRFQGRSDTEVVLNGYMQWGEGVAEKLRGMFAFGVWDDRGGRSKLVLGRDPVGVKPLCYYPTQHGVLFGSEPKSILAHPLAKAAVGISGWRELFAHVKSPGALIWDGMQEVKPGSTVTVDQNGIRERAYWQLRNHEHTDGPSDTVARVREMLERIVHEQLVADVPLGVLLSGGLDSSAITALAARERAALGRSIASYVIDFADHDRYIKNSGVLQEDRDTPYANEVAALWDTDHTVIELDPVRLASAGLREWAVRARDLAIGSGDVDVSHLLLFQAIRNQCTVALSGEMADELFGGYSIFSDNNALQGNHWPWHLRSPQDLANRLAMLTPELRAALEMDTYMADTYAAAVSVVERQKGESARDHRLREISYLGITRSAGYQLDFMDRLSMANGLEIRVPYCDHELIDYVYNVPWDIKNSGGRVKGLLKDAVSDLLPSSVFERAKSPYPHVPNPEYLQEIQRQGRGLAAQSEHPIFEVVSHDWLDQVVSKPSGQLTGSERYGLQQALELALWAEIYQPTMATV